MTDEPQDTRRTRLRHEAVWAPHRGAYTPRLGPPLVVSMILSTTITLLLTLTNAADGMTLFMLSCVIGGLSGWGCVDFTWARWRQRHPITGGWQERPR